MDAVQKAKPVTRAPMGMVYTAEVLWRDFRNPQPDQPSPAGPRPLVLSSLPRLTLIYSLLHLTGYDPLRCPNCRISVSYIQKTVNSGLHRWC